MDQLMEILTEVNADVDFETCDTLIDDGILDSFDIVSIVCLLYTSPSPRDGLLSRMPSSA